jgi:hypothetical protein
MTGSRIIFAKTYDVGTDLAVTAAESAGVCIRPHVRTVTDRATGESVSVPIPCGSTREAVCPTCAVKARRLRMHQCREGWHRTDADLLPTEALDDHGDADEHDEGHVDEQLEDDDEQGDDEVAADGVGVGRRVRSTRRLDGFPDLPTVPMENRTVGPEYVDQRDPEKAYRPSLFITLTLPSYGRVIAGTGVPRNPGSYDYRRAALDALLWPRLLDRFWQNLRRCAGYKVQYFSAIEAQRRLAPHLHAAVRGTIPRARVKAVVGATYYAAWWPAFERERFTEATGWPIFDRDTGRYVDPTTGVPLPTWEEATEDLDEPAHVASFGRQVDIKGLIAGSVDSDRAIRYLCKYLTKNVADTWTGQLVTEHCDAAAYERHTDRLHAEVLVLPCSSSCANWLRYGVTPKDAGPGLVPGLCSSPAHDRENLGLGGRRVLVSRQWSGKTLTQHRADRREVVAQVLAEAGIDAPEAHRLAADRTMPDGTARYVWTDADPDETTYVAVIAASLRQAQAWRTHYEQATAKVAQAKAEPEQRGSPPVDINSATNPAA